MSPWRKNRKVKRKRCISGWKKEMVVAMVGSQQKHMFTRMCVFFAILFLFFLFHLDDLGQLWDECRLQQRAGYEARDFDQD